MGTYAAVKFDQATKKVIHRYCAIAGIPNEIRPDKLHSTLLFSEVDLPDYQPTDQYSSPLVAYPIGLAVWNTTNEAGEINKCLVVLLDCPPLVARHQALMLEHNATYPFSTYQPHVTLSYNVGDLDIESLPFFDGYVPHVVIVGEYKQELNGTIDTSVDAMTTEQSVAT